MASKRKVCICIFFCFSHNISIGCRFLHRSKHRIDPILQLPLIKRSPRLNHCFQPLSAPPHVPPICLIMAVGMLSPLPPLLLLAPLHVPSILRLIVLLELPIQELFVTMTRSLLSTLIFRRNLKKCIY